jgi:sugar/nucleoside kinase (ribokinase family)
MTSSNIDIMMIGHFARDILVVDGQAENASGGAVYYGGMALLQLGVSVAIVTRLHPDDFPCLEELRLKGAQVFATPAKETSGIENIYDSADMERRICKSRSFAGPFHPEDIPNLSARIYLVAPIIAGEVDLPLLKSLSHVTYLKVDRAEAELLTGQTDLRVAARQLAGFGPREVVVTQSSGLTVFCDGKLYDAPLTPRSLYGRTGRGDTCFATYLGKRLSTSSQEACRFAAAVTTLKQEQPGPWRGSLSDVQALLNSWSTP